jgi:hypothetical protein
MKTDATNLMNALIQGHLDAVETARKARFDKSKSQTEKLLILGVLTTPDDEMDRAYWHAHVVEQAKLAGVSHAAMADALEYVRLADAIADDLRRQADAGETPDEHAARVRAAALEAGPRVAPGMKKPCTHRPTKQMMRALWCVRCAHDVWTDGVVREIETWSCSRCNLEVRLPRRPPRRTYASANACVILERIDRGAKTFSQDSGPAQTLEQIRAEIAPHWPEPAVAELIKELDALAVGEVWRASHAPNTQRLT